MWTRLKRISSVIFVITHLMPNDTFWITKPKFTTNINMFATSVEKDSGKYKIHLKILNFIYSEKATKFEKISSDHVNFFQQPSHQIVGYLNGN